MKMGRLQRTQYAHSILSPSDLLYHRLVSFGQCRFLGLENGDRSVVNDIHHLVSFLNIGQGNHLHDGPAEARSTRSNHIDEGHSEKIQLLGTLVGSQCSVFMIQKG